MNGFKQHTLSNGLTIVGETDATAHSAAVGFFVKTGARDEPSELMGVSHFLEHMMFKGTDDLSADDINRVYDEMGARNNAYTSHEVTCFYASVTADRIGDAIDHTARMMRPALREDDFETERGVILEEIAMYADNPFWVLYEQTSQRYYGDHPLGHRVLGTPETIKSLSRDSMAGYFNERYAPGATTVALAGDVDFDEACARIERLCGHWPSADAPPARAAPVPQRERLELSEEKFDRGYLLAIAPGPAAQSEDRYTATLAAQVLGAADNSRLHWALIEPGLAEEAQAGYQPGDGTGEFFVYASGDAAKLGEIEATLLRESLKLAESVSDDDLARIRSRFATSFTVSAERPGDTMQRIGRNWSLLGEYRPLSEELERIESVTTASMRALLAENGSDGGIAPLTIGTLTPPSGAQRT
ncbi:MAG: pitrilysin family protein [Planctomycetota bacterium]